MKRKLFFYMLLTVILLSVPACGKEEEPEGPRKFNPNKYRYYDGVAWVQLHEDSFWRSKYGDLVCIDEDGKELFSTTDVNIREVSNFANGIALVDERYVIDKTGNIVHDLEEELGVTIEMFPRYEQDIFGKSEKYSVERYFDGFIIVHKTVEDVMMTGILNSELEWVVEPTAKFQDICPKGNFLYYNSVMGFYDALTNEFIDKDEYQFRHMSRCFPESGMIFLEHQGNHAFNYSLGEAEGTIYLDNLDKTGFYDRNLQLLLDLSDYSSVMPLSDFQGDKCLIQFEDARDKVYVGLINLEGEFLFVRTGYRAHDSKKIKFNDCYYDWDGNCYAYES